MTYVAQHWPYWNASVTPRHIWVGADDAGASAYFQASSPPSSPPPPEFTAKSVFLQHMGLNLGGHRGYVGCYAPLQVRGALCERRASLSPSLPTLAKDGTKHGNAAGDFELTHTTSLNRLSLKAKTQLTLTPNPRSSLCVLSWFSSVIKTIA